MQQKGNFYLGNLQDSLPKEVVDKTTHVALEEQINNDFVEVDRQPLNLTQEFYTSIKITNPSSWFRYCFYSGEENLGYSQPILVEDIANIIAKIRKSLEDTNEDNPAFEDSEYYESLRFAFRQFRGDDHFIIRSEDIVPLETLVRKDFAMKIAYDYAKYIQLESHTGAKLNQSEVMTHYLQMVNALEQAYASALNRLNMGSGGYNDSGIITQLPKAHATKVKIRPHRSKSIAGRLSHVTNTAPKVPPRYIP